MSTPANITAALIQDLSVIGAFGSVGRNLSVSTDADPSRRYTFTQPAMRETPDTLRPGTQYIPALLRSTWLFGYTKSARSADTEANEAPFPFDTELYNTGRDLRLLFYRACNVTRIAIRIDVGVVTINAPDTKVSGQVIGGDFELVITYEDDCTTEGD